MQTLEKPRVGDPCNGPLPLAECRGGMARPPSIPVGIYIRFKQVQAELLLDFADTLNLLVDLYYDVKNGELVPREKCNSAGGGNGSQ